jgi:hypothetical protein
MSWTLQLNATIYSPDDEVIRGLRLQLVSLSADSLSFGFRAAVDADLPFAVGDAVILTQDSTVRFRGRIDAIDPTASGASEEISIACVGPWSWLDRIVYEQTWQVGNGVDGTLGNQSKTRIIIGQDDLGAKRSVGAEISAAVAWAVTQGADLQLAAVSIATTLHYQELVDVTCAELIRSVLRYLPDTMSWFDYSTSPPTLHLARRADLDTHSAALVGSSSDIRVRSRPDLQARGVVLYFESTYQYNDTVYPQVASQSAGSTTGERVIKATISLEGSGMTEERQRLKTYPISLTNAAFWVATVEALKGVAPSDLVVSSSSSEEEAIYDDDVVGTPLANFLLEGNISEWMGINARRLSAKAKIKYTGADATLQAQLGEDEERWYTLGGISTSGGSKTYRRVTSSWAGESVPSGLAAAMYAAMGVLHYEGSVAFEGEECDFALRPGLLLSLTGGRAEWATMNAAVQTVAHDIHAGTTLVQFGPAQQLSPQAFVEMLRANRTGRSTYQVLARTGTAAAAAISRGGEVQPVKDSQQVNGLPSGGEVGSLLWRNASDEPEWTPDGYEEITIELCDPDNPEAEPVERTILAKIIPAP